MKKYLVLLLGTLMILGFAASAFAIHAEIPSETQAVIAKGTTQITIGGQVRARGEVRSNTQDFNDDNKGTGFGAAEGSYYDLRVRLSVDAQITPGTSGRIHIQTGNDTDINDIPTWGTATSGARGIYRNGNAMKGDMRILEGWIQHKGSGLLGIPAGIKVGHMPLALGNQLFFKHLYFGDDAIVLFADPMKELHIGLLTVKFREGNISFSDDANGYVGLFTYTTKDWGISGDVTYVDDQSTADGLHFWNFGLRGNAKFGDLGLRGDIEFQAGDNGAVPTASDFKGWAGLVGIDYKLAPVTLTAEFAYGSGGDSGNGVTDTDGNVGAFVTSLDFNQHFTYVYDYRTVNACGNLQGGLCNTMYLKLGAQGDLAKNLNGLLNFYWLRAAEDVSLFGGPKDDDLGFEIDGKLTYKVDRNLTYWVEGGYLFAGDAWSTATRSADDAYAFRHGLQLDF